MANSSRKIIRGVRVDSKTYTPGLEDELNKVLSAETAKRLVDKGHLEGGWSGAEAKKGSETAKEK
jgi:hypothetical protein